MSEIEDLKRQKAIIDAMLDVAAKTGAMPETCPECGNNLKQDGHEPWCVMEVPIGAARNIKVRRIRELDAEVERLKGRERQSMALLNAVRSSEFDGVIRDDIARTEGVEGMFDPNRPEQDALNWVDARAAWLAGCKS